MLRNKLIEETLLQTALTQIQEVLPESWKVRLLNNYRFGRFEFDALLCLIPPRGDSIEFAVEVKPSGRITMDVLHRQLFRTRSAGFSHTLFVTDFVGPKLRSQLEGMGVSYADTTGWIRITTDDPPILLSTTGASRAPRDRSSSAVTRMNGHAAGRIIDALTSSDLPVRVRELADLAGVNPGSASKLLQTLHRESIVSRDSAGAVTDVDRWQLIERWVEDYSFTRTNKRVGNFVAPRGLRRTLQHLENIQTPVVVTGSAAARRLLPDGTVSVVPMHLLALYATDPMSLASELDLIESEPAMADVIIAQPNDSGIFLPEQTGTIVAPPAVVLADLLTLPNRSDAEARQLFTSLGGNAAPWRVNHEPTAR